MAYNVNNLYIDRGLSNNAVGESAAAHHRYSSTDDAIATVVAAGYLPDYLGQKPDQVTVNDLVTIDASDYTQTYKIDAVSPLSLVSIQSSQLVTNAVLLETTGGTPALLDYYEEGQFDVTLSGALSSPTVYTLYFTRIGNVVTLLAPGFTGAQSSATNIASGIGEVPARLRPIQNIVVPFAGTDNATTVEVNANLGTSGGITFYAQNGTTPNGDWGGTGNAQWFGNSLSYLV